MKTRKVKRETKRAKLINFLFTILREKLKNFMYNFVIIRHRGIMSGKGDREEKRLKEYEKCDHDWRPAGTTEGHTHLRLVCSKCGETTLIELFP